MNTTREKVQIGTEEATILLNAQQTQGDVFALEVMMPPGGGPPVPHRHAPAELYRVESGELTLYVEGDDGSLDARTAAAGDVVHIPGSRLHTIRNESNRDARALAIFIPGAAMEAFFRGASESDPAEIARIAQRHGISFEGDPR